MKKVHFIKKAVMWKNLSNVILSLKVSCERLHRAYLFIKLKFIYVFTLSINACVYAYIHNKILRNTYRYNETI